MDQLRSNVACPPCRLWGHIAWRPAPFSGVPVCVDCGEAVDPETVERNRAEIMEALGEMGYEMRQRRAGKGL